MIDFLVPPTDAMKLYASQLYTRVGEGIVVPRVRIQLDEWKPQPRLCHQNVFTWIEKVPGQKAVHGWLYFDFGGYLPIVRFTAHSVVEDQKGELLDITPILTPREYPFVRANIPEEEFGQMVVDLTACYGAAHLDHLK